MNFPNINKMTFHKYNISPTLVAVSSQAVYTPFLNFSSKNSTGNRFSTPKNPGNTLLPFPGLNPARFEFFGQKSNSCKKFDFCRLESWKGQQCISGGFLVRG